MDDKFQQDADLESPQCHECTHWISGTLTCKAYPQGIPIGILTNEVLHDEPIPGDNGVYFHQR